MEIPELKIIASRISDFLSGWNEYSFDELALQLFHIQKKHCAVYREFLQVSGLEQREVKQLEDIPFLPVSFFKSHMVHTGEWTPSIRFESSTTGGSTPSIHDVLQVEWYEKVCITGFESFYGNPAEWTILALLPSYLERKNASLVHMVQTFYNYGAKGGFFLRDLAALQTALSQRKGNTMLIGVSYALLDLAEEHPGDYSGTVVMETGGMKGRRKEITRHMLHKNLMDPFNVEVIHSEYGMTELFSQAYAKNNGLFTPSRLMHVLPRSLYDPFSLEILGRQAALNIIDLGNWATCSFLASDDIGKVYANGQFEVLGRLELSDIRGCNLMVI